MYSKKKGIFFFKIEFSPCFFFQNIVLSLEDRDAEELILVLCGYHKLLTERELDVIQDTAILQQQEEEQQQQGIYIRYTFSSNRNIIKVRVDIVF